MPISRRSLLELLSSSTFFLTVSPMVGLAAELVEESVPLEFPQGVASGDPQPNGVMLWTRAVPLSGERSTVYLQLQVSADSSFSKVLLQEL